MEGMKTCARCRRVRPLDEFNACSRTLDGKQSYCRWCRNAYMRQWKRRHREKTRRWQALRRERMKQREMDMETPG